MKKIILIVALCFVGFHVNAMENSTLGVGNQLYIQNTNITGTLDESHDVIKVGNHVTTTIATGDVNTTNANITLRAKEVLLDSGTHISAGTTLETVNP